ncbi:hypothetical protein BT96DRAFT_513770 [Gymnopus androsaceus JB14]|uniref:DUF6534 domain-containing protein n=1 Tax=Gymnopus androsaceus JB14 TaxID=1447944 RepID=A0A6A4GNB2_9AGAR|nr:hypothetical protein BT96DRAFT_513770 [Gymnopus androsaceus JB14]
MSESPICAPLPIPDLGTTYGAMLIGVIFATFLQGILTLQTVIYYDSYPSDPISTKLTVAIVWCFDTFHLVLIAQSAYHYLINNWGVLPALAVSTWELDVNILFIGLSSFVCQLFFMKRIWIFSKRNVLLIGFLAALCTTIIALDILVTVQILQNRSVAEFGEKKTEIIITFTLGAISDLVLASLLCYYVRRNTSGFEKTDSMISLIVKYAVTTGLVTSIWGILTLVAYFASPDGFSFVAMHFSLGRLYTNALLATLNSRKNLRSILQGTTLKSSARKEETGEPRNESMSMSIPLGNYTV